MDVSLIKQQNAKVWFTPGELLPSNSPYISTEMKGSHTFVFEGARNPPVSYRQISDSVSLI